MGQFCSTAVGRPYVSFLLRTEKAILNLALPAFLSVLSDTCLFSYYNTRGWGLIHRIRRFSDIMKTVGFA